MRGRERHREREQGEDQRHGERCREIGQVGRHPERRHDDARHRADGAHEEHFAGARVPGPALGVVERDRDEQRIHRRRCNERQEQQDETCCERAENEAPAGEQREHERIEQTGTDDGKRRDRRHERVVVREALAEPLARNTGDAPAGPVAERERDERDGENAGPDVKAHAEVGRHDARGEQF